MTLPIFDFPMHSVTHNYPKGSAFQFGRGWQFNAAPQLPVQRTFRLHFSAMQWFLDGSGNVDNTTNSTWNIQTLIEFYEGVRTYAPFTYNHPAYGPMTVKFAADQTFEVPKSLDGGTGATESFDLFFVEQPQ